MVNMLMSLMDEKLITALKYQGTDLEDLIKKRTGYTDKEELGYWKNYFLCLIPFIPSFMRNLASSDMGRKMGQPLKRLMTFLEEYFLEENDIIPDKGKGLVGFLDDAYLVILILQNLKIKSESTLLDKESLDSASHNLRFFIGDDLANKVECIAQIIYSQFSETFTNKLSELVKNADYEGDVEYKEPWTAKLAQKKIPQNLDQRLLGVWYKTTYRSFSSISYTHQIKYILNKDGRFIESRESYATANFYNQYGEWVDWNAITSRIKPEHRGKWSTKGNKLCLNWDNKTYVQYTYEYIPDSLLLTTRNGNSFLWTRSG